MECQASKMVNSDTCPRPTTQVVIRGKGSVKDGRRARRDGKMDPSEGEELHVHITAPDEDSLVMAAERVRALLVPIDDEKNLHKQQQVCAPAAILALAAECRRGAYC